MSEPEHLFFYFFDLTIVKTQLIITILPFSSQYICFLKEVKHGGFFHSCQTMAAVPINFFARSLSVDRFTQKDSIYE